MRALPGALTTLLESNTFTCADLYEFDVGGTTYRLTSCDRNLTGVSPAAAATYTAANLDCDRIRSSDGLQVDDLEITVAHVGTEGLGGTAWYRLALDGELDEAPVRVYRAYLDRSDWSVVGCYLRFAGVISDLDPGSTSMRIVVAVSANEFGRTFPAVTYEKNCVWNFAGTGCEYAGTVGYDVTVGSSSTAALLQIDALPGGITNPGRFFMGTVVAGGFTRTITDVPGAVTYGFTVTPPFPTALVIGSTVSIRLGCNKTAVICNDWHSNLVHFMGAPLAPANT